LIPRSKQAAGSLRIIKDISAIATGRGSRFMNFTSNMSIKS
jgi:hypothetical protein